MKRTLVCLVCLDTAIVYSDEEVMTCDGPDDIKATHAATDMVNVSDVVKYAGLKVVNQAERGQWVLRPDGIFGVRLGDGTQVAFDAEGNMLPKSYVIQPVDGELAWRVESGPHIALKIKDILKQLALGLAPAA